MQGTEGYHAGIIRRELIARVSGVQSLWYMLAHWQATGVMGRP
jgi:hypothetical protein